VRYFFCFCTHIQGQIVQNSPCYRLHHSQKEEASGEEYSLFSYYLSPHAYDFKQALLSLMAEVEVLAPASQRLEMQTIINDMATKYQPQ
jgi:hypothetical protein